MLPLLRSELFRLSRRWMPRVLLLIVLLGVVGIYALLWLTLATQDAGDTEGLDEDLALVGTRDIGLGIVNFFASILAVIIGASVVGTEYGWGTIRALLPRARSRLNLMAAKLAALVIFDVVMIVAGFLAALAMSALVTSAENLDGDLGDDFLLESVLAVGRTVYVLLPYTALAFFVAVLTRSNAAGIAIGLAVLFAESIVLAIVTSITDIFDWLGDILFTENAAAITDLNDGTRSDDLANPWTAAFILGLWIVGLVGVAAAVFQRRDVTSGS
jgi:ABC-type transport system involved in multi-copper enzyme maturation permease subunit